MGRSGGPVEVRLQLARGDVDDRLAHFRIDTPERGRRIDSGGEEDLALVHVADAGRDALVEQNDADFGRLVVNREAPQHLGAIEASPA